MEFAVATNRRFLSLNEAARILRERGLKPSSRYALTLAIARKELRIVEDMPRGVLLRVADLELFASKFCSSANDATASIPESPEAA